MSNKNPIDDLQHIRKLMEDSSKFLSLSGLSGIFAGLTAIGGAVLAHYQIKTFNTRFVHYVATGKIETANTELEIRLLLIAAAVLILAMGFGILFSAIKAKKHQQKLLTPVAYRVLRSLLVPLAFGGLFVIALIKQGHNGYPVFHLIAPAMLIFYGMALLNVSKYLTVEIKYLALSELLLGAYLAFFPGNGLIIWAIGFGIFHIVYGAVMYFKYEYTRKSK